MGILHYCDDVRVLPPPPAFSVTLASSLHSETPGRMIFIDEMIFDAIESKIREHTNAGAANAQRSILRNKACCKAARFIPFSQLQL